MEILHIEDLTFRYPNAENGAIENVSLKINSGDFVVICGMSGCGKTTLLKLIKKELSPVGAKSGKIYYSGIPLEQLDDRTSAAEIGYVMQNPDNQIVTDKVWHELAFGLENLGVPNEVIRRRVGEMASYFGIESWFRKNTDELSGGQKQVLNLASVMVMQPKILLLDEPTGQLDPIAASEFIMTLQKLNHETGLTILIAEHRTEQIFPVADKAVIMENGRILVCDEPRRVGERLRSIDRHHPMLLALPSAARIADKLNLTDEAVLTVKDGRSLLERHFSMPKNQPNKNEYIHEPEVAVELKNVWFRYARELPDIMRGASLKVFKNEIFCILGGNGTGKTTTLNVIASLNKPYKGKVLIDGKSVKTYKNNSLYKEKIALLPQNPQVVFISDTVKADLESLLQTLDVPKEKRAEQIDSVCEKLGITALLNRHPYDLSGGEQQKCALAKVLLSNPEILLLDEPTKGIDAFSKKELGTVLQKLKRDGMTVIMVTHDVEFAAENADRCALFFDGEILSAEVPKRFFSENNFYSTAANRIARGFDKTAVTVDDVVKLFLERGDNS